MALNLTSRKNGRERSKTLSNGDKRLGFIQKLIDSERPARSIYGIGIDNMGDPYRGVMDKEINTPLGDIGFGYDGDTVYGNINPAIYADMVGGENPAAWAGIGDLQARIGAYNTPEKSVFASLNFPDNVNLPDIARSLNTPLGRLDVGTNDGNPNIYADFTPQNYVQAIVNLLRRGR